MLRIAVYDDNVSRRESLNALISLSQNMECVGTYGNCANILKNVATDKPDLILMDIEMPIVNGLEGVVIVKENFPHIKIIIQTAFDDDDKILTALRYGAEGYILKNASVLRISQSIDEVMAGGASMSPSIALKVMRFFSSKESVVGAAGALSVGVEPHAVSISPKIKSAVITVFLISFLKYGFVHRCARCCNQLGHSVNCGNPRFECSRAKG